MDQRELDATFFPVDQIDAVTIINAQLIYSLQPNWRLTLQGRNLNDTQQREFLYGDDSRRLVLVGVEYAQP